MDSKKPNQLTHTDDETLSDFVEQRLQTAQQERKESFVRKRSTTYHSLMLFFAAVAAVGALLAVYLVYFPPPTGLRKEPGPDPDAVQSYYDSEEIYFTVGQSDLEEGYADKVMSLLNRIPQEESEKNKNVENKEEDRFQLFVVCSGDSRGDPKRTRDISDQRACAVKGHIAEKIKEVNKERWEKARLWSFGAIVTPGLKRPRGEDFNCRCTVIATTDSGFVEQRFLDKLREVRPRDDLKDYEIPCNSYHHHNSN